MTTYLTIPCPRCGEKELKPPEKTGSRLYSQCDNCTKKSLYIIHDHVDGKKAYSIVPVGAKGQGMVRATFWITQEQENFLNEHSPFPRMKSQVVRSALNLYCSHTLRVNS